MNKSIPLSAVDHAKITAGATPDSPSTLSEQKCEEDDHKLDCHFPMRGSPPITERENNLVDGRDGESPLLFSSLPFLCAAIKCLVQ